MASFVSVLKKIGLVLLDGSQIAAEVLGFPFISNLIGKTRAAALAGDFNTLAGIISAVEAMFPSTAGQKTGPLKLTASSPLVQQQFLSWAKENLAGHHNVKDPALLAEGSAELTQGFVKCMNALGE